MNLVDLFKEGGFIMYPLLICSIIIWFVVFEKYWGLFQFNKENTKLLEQAKDLLKELKFDQVRGLFSNADLTISAPYIALIDSFNNQEEDTEEGLTENVMRRLKETQMSLKRYLWMLGTIGSLAPFIGLFGTVVGIIKSFEDMAQTGRGGFAVVSAGLSEALIATAAGIIVAIIALIFYNYFLNRLNIMNISFRHGVEDLSDMIKQTNKK